MGRVPWSVRALALALKTLAPDGRPYLRKMYEVAGHQVSRLRFIHEFAIPVLLPAEGQTISELLAEIEGMDDEQWLALLQSKRTGEVRWAIHFGPETSVSLEDLRAILERAPEVATTLFSSFLNDSQKASDLADGEPRAILARGLRNSMQSLAYMPEVWGFALANGVAPPELSEEVARQRAQARMAIPKTEGLDLPGLVYPFQLDVERDGALVPMISWLMADRFEFLMEYIDDEEEDAFFRWEEQNDQFVELLGRYGSLQTFESFVLSAGDPAAQIGGAILALLTRAVDQVAFCLKHAEVLERAVRAEPCMGPLLAKVCVNLDTLIDPRMLALFDGWLDASSGNHEALLKWRPTIVLIRETPIADGLRSRIDTLVPLLSRQ